MYWEIDDSFESLELCCLTKRSWDTKRCIDESSKPISLRLKFDLKGLPEPTNCQDSNRIANSLEDSLNVGLSGSGGTASVIEIGDVTLGIDPDTGSSECGGSLAGMPYLGDYIGNRPPGYYDFDQTISTTIQVEVAMKCDQGDCDTMCSTLFADFTSFTTSGSLQEEIRNRSGEGTGQSIPNVIELAGVSVDTTSLEMIGDECTSPLGDLGIDDPFYPDWVTFGNTCMNDGLHPLFMRRPENVDGFLFSTREECCNEWFKWDPYCIDEGDPDLEKYYPLEDGSNQCSKKKVVEFERDEIFRYSTLEECCINKFNYAKEECCEESPGMGGCPLTGTIVWMPKWGSNENKCEQRNEEYLRDDEVEFSRASEEECCEYHYPWPGSGCLDSEVSDATVWMPKWGSSENKCQARTTGSLKYSEKEFARASEEECCDAHYSWAVSECLD